MDGQDRSPRGMAPRSDRLPDDITPPLTLRVGETRHEVEFLVTPTVDDVLQAQSNALQRVDYAVHHDNFVPSRVINHRLTVSPVHTYVGIPGDIYKS